MIKTVSLIWAFKYTYDYDRILKKSWWKFRDTIVARTVELFSFGVK